MGNFLDLALLIPIVAIVGGISAGVVKNILEHSERRLQIKAQMTEQSAGGSLRAEVEALREEVARLRDTSTQYDISIQHTLEDLQHRMATVESRGPRLDRAAEEPAPAVLQARGK